MQFFAPLYKRKDKKLLGEGLITLRHDLPQANQFHSMGFISGLTACSQVFFPLPQILNVLFKLMDRVVAFVM